MAVLPTAQSFGRRQSSGAPAPVAQLSRQDAGAVGRAVEGLGETAYESGDMILDREATAAAKERDTYVSDEIRRIMFDPQAGFANLYGKEAVSARENVKEQLEALKGGATKGLNPAARRKLEATLNRRIESALNRVETHTATERRTWLNGAAEAQITANRQDALFGVVDVSEAYQKSAGVINATAQREGWDDAKRDLRLREARSELVADQITRTAQDDPEMALDMVRKNADALLPMTRMKLEAKLEPLAKEAEGNRLGDQIYEGRFFDPNHSTKIEFELEGKKRPNPPAPKLQNLLGVSAERALGTGARVVIYSGQEEQGHQHGSNRHRTGLAADVRVYDASGNLLKLSDPRARAFMVQAASLGARGIGAGSEYMGDAFHIDMVPHNQYGANQGPVWGSASSALRGDLLGAMSSGEFQAGSLEDIEDEDIREIAATRIRQRQSESAITNQFASAELGVRVSAGEADQADIDAALGDGTITASRWEALSEQIVAQKEAQRKKYKALNDFNVLLEQGGTPNSHNSDHRKAVNLLDDSLKEQLGPGNEEALMQQRLQVLGTTKVAPSGLVEDLRLGMAQRSPEAFVAADMALQIAPDSMAGVDGGGEVQAKIDTFRAYTGVGFSSEDAARYASPTAEEQALNKVIEADITKEIRSFDGTEVVSAFDSWMPLDATGMAEPLRQKAERDFTELYQVARRDGLPANVAKEWSRQRLTNSSDGLYGVSEVAMGQFHKASAVGEALVSGLSMGQAEPNPFRPEPGVMKLPPEHFYPEINGGHDYLLEDIKETLAGLENWNGGAWFLIDDEKDTAPFVKRHQRGENVYPGYLLKFIGNDGMLDHVYWRIPEDRIEEMLAPERAEKRSNLDKLTEIEERLNSARIEDSLNPIRPKVTIGEER